MSLGRSFKVSGRWRGRTSQTCRARSLACGGLHKRMLSGLFLHSCIGDLHRSGNMAALCASIQSLSDDVLRRVLILLPHNDRMQSVPLVCSRWHRITADASMWPIVHVMPRISQLHPKSEHPNNMQTWLRQRSPGMHQLIVRFRGFDTMLLQPALRSVGPTAANLQSLQLMSKPSFEGHIFSAEALECVSQLRSLTRLEVSFISTPLRQGSLDDVFASLPALEFVGLHFRTSVPEGSDSDDSIDEDRPDDFPRSLLRCTRLTQLDLSMYHPRTYNDMFTVGGLPSGITALQRLQHLQLGDCVTEPLTCGLSRMTQLTHLAVLQAELHNADICDPDDPEALPASLRVLDASQVSEEVLAQLTALDSLSLGGTVSLPEDICSLSGLQRLTLLKLGTASDAVLQAVAGCTNLRTLCIHALELAELEPLRFPHLTRLQLEGDEYEMSDVVAMISELPNLEILEVLDTSGVFEVYEEDAVALAALPKLRTVSLSGSLLWDPDRYSDTPRGVPPEKYLPLAMVQHMMRLQLAAPHIEWVL